MLERPQMTQKTIWHRRKGIHNLNTQVEGRKLDTAETHYVGEQSHRMEENLTGHGDYDTEEFLNKM